MLSCVPGLHVQGNHAVAILYVVATSNATVIGLAVLLIDAIGLDHVFCLRTCLSRVKVLTRSSAKVLTRFSSSSSSMYLPMKAKDGSNRKVCSKRHSPLRLTSSLDAMATPKSRELHQRATCSGLLQTSHTSVHGASQVRAHAYHSFVARYLDTLLFMSFSLAYLVISLSVGVVVALHLGEISVELIWIVAPQLTIITNLSLDVLKRVNLELAKVVLHFLLASDLAAILQDIDDVSEMLDRIGISTGVIQYEAQHFRQAAIEQLEVLLEGQVRRSSPNFHISPHFMAAY